VAPRITLSTDFGTRDSYVAQLKGVLYSEGPADLQVVDLSHELAPFDVLSAAWFVREAITRFPPQTLHLVVVDPGVGSARRPIVARVADQVLVGPDNGVFGALYDGGESVLEIEPARLGGRALSSTFHGRDLFAPAAARLARGEPCEGFARVITDYARLALPEPRAERDVLVGQVMHVDHYGNLVTNLSAGAVRALGHAERLTFQILGQEVAPLRDHYAQVQPGELIALVGSSDRVEISVREGSAAERLRARLGTLVRACASAVRESS